jgi:hypothetical protein
VLSRKALVRGVTSEPVPDADASYPLISQVPMAPTGRAKRKSAPAVDDPDRTRASSPKRL